MLSSTLTTSHGWSLARRSCAWCQKQGVSFNFTCKKCGESFSLCNRVCQKELVRVHDCAERAERPGQRSLVDDSLPPTLAHDSLGLSESPGGRRGSEGLLSAEDAGRRDALRRQAERDAVELQRRADLLGGCALFGAP